MAVYFIEKLKKYKVSELIPLIHEKLIHLLFNLILNLRDLLLPTKSSPGQFKIIYTNTEKNGYILSPDEETMKYMIKLARNYINHEFNIFGYSWYNLNSSKKQLGIQRNEDYVGDINRANRVISKNILQMLPNDYKHLNWHSDIRVGYRWSPSTWYKKVNFTDVAPADIKFPWEFGRMHQIVNIALCCCFTPEKIYPQEFQSQILDFIGHNPPRFGVNWKSTMDVSIRLINWIFAFDLLQQSNVQLPSRFIGIFYSSCYEHFLHICNNLDFTGRDRGNHYFSNLVALLFFSTSFHTNTSNKVLAFSIDQIFNEILMQFNMDGSSFESSTYYHLLTSEMLIFALARILSIPEKIFINLYNVPSIWIGKKRHFINLPNKMFVDCGKVKIKELYIERLLKIFSFIDKIKDHNNLIPQIGDNDSGKLFKLNPKIELGITKYKYNDTRPILDMISVLLNNYTISTNSLSLEAQMILFLNNNNHIEEGEYSTEHKNVRFETDVINNNQKGDLETKFLLKRRMGISKRKSYKFEGNILNKLKIYSFEQFGIFVYKSSRLYLCIRCGYKNQITSRGHAHYDQLSITLVVDDNYYLKDPGSFVYTSSKEKRNLYRSTRAHNVPYDIEIDNKDLLFKTNDIVGECLIFKEHIFVGRVKLGGLFIHRIVKLKDQEIIIIDILPEELDAKFYPSNIQIQHSIGYSTLDDLYENAKIW